MRKIATLRASLAAFYFVLHVNNAHTQGLEGDGNVTQPTETKVWQNAETYLPFLVDAAVNAVNIVASQSDSIFASPEGVAVQTSTEKTVAVSVFFVPEESYPGHVRGTASHSLCQVTPVAEGAGIKTRHLIICNLDTLRRFDILVRLAHATAFFNARLRNDWAFMQLLKEIESHPDQVMAAASSDVQDDHMNEHMSFLLAFVLAHESWHLKRGSVSHFEHMDDAELPTTESDLPSRVVCRNYHEFARRGKQFEIALSLIPLSEEGTTEDPTERRYFSNTRSIWQEELEADEYAANLLASVVLRLRQENRGEHNVQRVFSETLQHFGLLALMLWHSRLEPFVEEHCVKNAGQDFYLTRCMCTDRDRYKEVVQLFGATHPPIVLRMYAAARSFFHRLGIDRDVNAVFPGHSPELVAAVNWFNIIDALTDAPLKLALPVCLGVPDYVADAGRVVQVIPDLAGFFGGGGSKSYPGYPADESVFFSECAGLE